jgi:hypothetical protein
MKKITIKCISEFCTEHNVTVSRMALGNGVATNIRLNQSGNVGTILLDENGTLLLIGALMRSLDVDHIVLTEQGIMGAAGPTR